MVSNVRSVMFVLCCGHPIANLVLLLWWLSGPKKHRGAGQKGTFTTLAANSIVKA